MKNFLKKIFTKNKEESGQNSLTPINILEYAISDGGVWSWWVEDFPNTIQLEFNRTMLYFDPKLKDKAPSNQIAIQFKQPKSVNILKKKECALDNNWLKDFHADKLEPFCIDYEHFSFSPQEVVSIVRQADVTETFFGIEISDAEIFNSNVSLGFWAGDVGIVILAGSMRIVNHDGEILLDQIPEIHNKWWSYWKLYWDVINTDKAMPYDPICEITIPAGKWNMKK